MKEEGLLDAINNLKKEVKSLSLEIAKLQDFVYSKDLELSCKADVGGTVLNNLRLLYGPKGKNYAGLDVKTLGLRTDLEMDDLDIVEFVLKLEEIFDVGLTDKDWEKWETVNDVVKTIENKIAKGVK